jgi:hypothetical protein
MKQSIYHSSEHQFPVNYLKSDTELPKFESTAADKKAGDFFEGKTNLHGMANSLKDAVYSTNIVENSVKLSHNGVLLLMRSFRLLFLAFCHLLKPWYKKGVGQYQRWLKITAGYLDAFFNFMESFLFLDEAVLQPAVLPQTDKPSQSRQFVSDSSRTMKTGARHRFFKAFGANPSINEANSFGGSNNNTPGRRFNSTILPKIKLPLKTNNPDVWPPRLLFHYPVGEFLQLTFSRCNKLLRLNPKHLNAGLKQHFKPVFKAVN